ncbi:MAG: protein kinase [Deltaproteobacteria bacterium]|nr:protein kinase [Deltaproteobacteria bacterium]
MAFTVHARLGRGRTVESFSATLEVGAERLEVVVKRPRPELARNEVFTQALLAWGRAQAELDHERVVAVLESGRASEGVYVIQEQVDGVPLAAVLKVLRKRRRTLSPGHALMVARQTAEAVAYLGQGGRPGHGDLDPGEILVSYEGEVQVADAQLSRLGAHVGADLLEDEERSAYQPPEVRAGQAPGPPADVYALSLILLEMLIGHPVWTAETMTVKDAVAALTDFTHIGQASPGLTKDLLALLEPCLSDDPAARPTAAALQEGLQSIQLGHSLLDDALSLGTFVQAVLPPKEDEDAPTQMMTVEQAEKLAARRAAKADWDAASVLINPEIEARAAAWASGARAASAAPRPPSAAPGGQLVAAAIPLAEATQPSWRRPRGSSRPASPPCRPPRPRPPASRSRPRRGARWRSPGPPRAPRSWRRAVRKVSCRSSPPRRGWRWAPRCWR